MKPGTTSWVAGIASRRLGGVVTRAAASLSAVALAAVTLAGCAAPTRSENGAPTSAAPAHITLTTATAPFGTYLTDSAGRALYLWDADRGGSPTCYGDCARAWPPVTVAGTVSAGPAVQASLIAQVKRTDGTEQVTYGGWPLYFYRTDVRAGELSGQGDTGFGAVWWLVAPDGTPLPSEPQG